MKITKNGLDIIKIFESCRLKAYRCPSNILTIGWGHTGKDVTENMVISQFKADYLLQQDVKERELQINELKLNLNQNQYDSLVSLVYNIGIGTFKRSGLYKMLQVNPNSINIKTEWSKFVCDRNGNKLPGLVRRRNKELELYFK